MLAAFCALSEWRSAYPSRAPFHVARRLDCTEAPRRLKASLAMLGADAALIRRRPSVERHLSSDGADSNADVARGPEPVRMVTDKEAVTRVILRAPNTCAGASPDAHHVQWFAAAPRHDNHAINDTRNPGRERPRDEPGAATRTGGGSFTSWVPLSV